MAPRVRSSTGFRGVRLRLSGRWSAEITQNSVRWWMGTFDAPELAAGAFDVAVWRFGRPRAELNFPDVRSLQEAEFLAPEVRMVTREQELENRRAVVQLRIRRDDEAAMERLRREHPELVQAQMEFDAERDAKMRARTSQASTSRASTSRGGGWPLNHHRLLVRRGDGRCFLGEPYAGLLR